MQLPEKFKEYAELVTRQMRWKRARPVIEREITTHLCDQRDALVSSGMDEDAAVEESIRQMGDAVEIGTGLDRVHRPRPSWSLLVLTAILVLTGLAIKAFITYDADYPNELPKMLVAAGIGLVCLLAAYFIDFTVIGKWPVFFYAASVLVVLFLMWNKVGVFGYSSVWPDYLTLCLPVGYAALLYKLRGKRYLGLLFALAGLALALCVCLLIPSSAAVLIVAVSGVAVLAVAVWGGWFQLGKLRGNILLIVCVLVGIAWCIWYVMQSPTIMQRIETAFHPELDPDNRGWMGIKIREILSGAKLIGTGDSGRYATEIPVMLTTTSWLLTCLIHLFGWISLIVILAVFAAFFAVAIYKCVKQKNMLGRMVSLAVILTLTMQVFLYVLLNLGFYLIEDLSLPLVSYGNMTLIVDMALIGLMLSVFRTGSLARDEKLPVYGKSAWKDHVRWNDGELTISFKKKIAS